MTDTNVIDIDNSKEISKFSRTRLHSSIETSCLSVKIPEGQASRIANLTCDDIEKWLIDKQEVTIKDMINKTAAFLERYHADAAYFYEQKHIII